MQKLIKKMQKGELHVHLNGLASTSLVQKLLIEEKAEIPAGFNLNVDLLRTSPSTDLETYLKPWQVLRLIPRSKAALGLVIDSAFENLQSQNVTFVELRNSVIYIALLNNITISTALSWLIHEIDRASDKYSIKAGLIITISRGDYAPDHLRSLMEAYVQLGRPDRVIGLDLAGNEDTTSPVELGQLFRKAKEEQGLKITIHAGETGNPENIRDAIINFDADRIGHGTAAYKSLAVMDMLRDRDICVEVCPISNRLTGAVGAHESHPVSEFIKMGVPFVICSDNPSIHDSNINEDYLEFYRETHNIDILESMLNRQIKYTFLRGIN
ncbi:adenosine deaminase family protein [Pseudomonas sp. PDM09]|uniref:adenosine deaminase family protein n=1 Tax=Pseudomonas sp. PDM09 TaxID=2769270 RepID=UPI001782E5A5|nr:adenosine deaminase [Pseudomonas sp. PDM09]MBD9561723.1 adenosine deaminase [Pseudomonas sp. PDM09]